MYLYVGERAKMLAWAKDKSLKMRDIRWAADGPRGLRGTKDKIDIEIEEGYTPTTSRERGALEAAMQINGFFKGMDG